MTAIPTAGTESFRAVGVVVGSHGLHGTLRVTPLSDFPERFDALREVFFRLSDRIVGRDEVRRVRWSGANLLIEMRTCNSRESAEALRGVELCVPDAESWALPEDTYYSSDLFGFRGIGGDTVLGELAAIHRGAQDILEFHGEFGEIMVPLVKQWIGRIDIAERTIEVLSWRELVNTETVPTF